MQASYTDNLSEVLNFKASTELKLTEIDVLTTRINTIIQQGLFDRVSDACCIPIYPIYLATEYLCDRT